MSRALGIDPGSRATGFGVVDLTGNRLVHVACGAIHTPSRASAPERLAIIYRGLLDVIERHRPEEVGVESIFQARNARSALVLGQARGVALLSVELARLPIVEYTPMQVKLAVVGYGRAEKGQVQEMVRRLLALPEAAGPDASDALAVAICHLQTSRTARAVRERGAALVRPPGPR
ncbi:MAG: crossover junction endodeoxyribonuclease RuvC [Deltaproteobacteria bacterium]|nr:crossover junction endodeoxyribonuclease RuvC [Deltaproteobacteria bacterium]